MSDLDTQLLYAAEDGDANLCVDLLSLGARIAATHQNGRSALHLAAWHGHTAACLALIEHGASVNALDAYGFNPLHLAVKNDDPGTCLLLLEHGCNPQTKNEEGQTALERAVKHQHGDCIDVIESFVAAQAARAALREITASRPFSP